MSFSFDQKPRSDERSLQDVSGLAITRIFNGWASMFMRTLLASGQYMEFQAKPRLCPTRLSSVVGGDQVSRLP
jgi:hypothetical protein